MEDNNLIFSSHDFSKLAKRAGSSHLSLDCCQFLEQQLQTKLNKIQQTFQLLYPSKKIMTKNDLYTTLRLLGYNITPSSTLLKYSK